MDCSLPGSSVHGIFQAERLEKVAISDPGIKPTSFMSPELAGRLFATGFQSTVGMHKDSLAACIPLLPSISCAPPRSLKPHQDRNALIP